MAPRPIWKGYLKLSLVSCSVAMYTATSTSSRIRLHILNRETGTKMAAGDRDGVDRLLAQFVGNLTQLTLVEAAEVVGGMNLIEQGSL